MPVSDNISLAQTLALLSKEERDEYLSKLGPEGVAALRWSWPFWARPDQLEPEGNWTTWLILAGRGWGKTRTGAETVRNWVCGPTPTAPGRYKRIALVAETTADARGVMVDGESGLLNIGPKEFRPEYFPSLRQLVWPNGAIANTYNATEPDQLRGPQHDAAWCDEMAKWKYMEATWDQLQFGLRLGTNPKQVITTTPQPKKLIKSLVAKAVSGDPSVYLTKGRTYDNRDNLAAPFIGQIEERFGGTRLGRQELEGEILNDIPGALWSRDSIDTNRLTEAPLDLERVIVAVDPSASSNEGSDENGIVVVGLARDEDGYARGYILEDGSLRGTPEEWSKKAVKLYRKWQADKIVAEKNQGGEMVLAVLRSADRSVPVKLVHASRGKAVRAEPISALYEQGRIHHVGRFDELEDQMCTFSVDNVRGSHGNGSPDRVDALVWGLTEIFDKITARRRKEKDPSQLAASNEYFQRRWNTSYNDCPTGWMAG